MGNDYGKQELPGPRISEDVVYRREARHELFFQSSCKAAL